MLATLGSIRLGAEGKKQASEGLPFDAIMSMDAFDSGWKLAFVYGERQYIHRPEDLVAMIDNKALDYGQTFRMKKYFAEIRKALPALVEVNGQDLYYLRGFPFDLGTFNKQYCIVASVASDMLYNTLRLESTRRAAKAIETMVIPAIVELSDHFGATDIGYLAVVLTYGTKDFLEESTLAVYGEGVALVAAQKDARAFADGEISDAELLRRSAVFFRVRETFDFRRKEISLSD